jgi:NAD(P)-dependent dehydrogenase (short-subunit alcohol dehydrogenase family)
MGSSVAYSVTKAAGLQLMKNLAFSQGPKIRVNAVLPGLLMTEWVLQFSDSSEWDADNLFLAESKISRASGRRPE